MLIFGICGALRCAEFTNLKCSQVEDINNKFLVSIQDTKTDIDRTFIIGPMFYSKVKEYISLKPTDQFTDRFFIQYLNGKCHRQVMGKNKIGSVPSTIASFLQLENSSRYTGHCFRRTAATLLSNSGANMAMLKQLGGWRSDSVASGYIANSMKTKTLIYQGITHENKTANDASLVQPSTSNQNPCPSNVSNNNVIQSREIDELQITYEDFSDENLSDPLESTKKQELNLSVDFRNGKQKPMPPVLLENKTENVNTRNLFTTKQPVKLTFTTTNMNSIDLPSSNRTRIEPSDSSLANSDTNRSMIQNIDVPPSKKIRLDENANSSTHIGTENITPMQNVQQNTIKDSTVKFENCTITGNITNNYYYYYGHNNK